jgi:hypothetical protein
MKITKRQLRRIIKEEKARLLREQMSEDPSTTANRLLDETMSFLENKLYGKYPDEEVDAFAVDAMRRMGDIEQLIVNLINGGYREDY